MRFRTQRSRSTAERQVVERRGFEKNQTAGIVHRVRSSVARRTLLRRFGRSSTRIKLGTTTIAYRPAVAVAIPPCARDMPANRLALTI